MRIGVFDSGIGGLTVLTEALSVLPDEDYIYYADTLHVPYGEKPKDVVRKYIFDAVDFMAAEGIKALVVACNTATSIAVQQLRESYRFPVIGMEPAVKPAVLKNGSNGKRVLVFATQLTLMESKYQQLVSSLDHHNIVDSLPLPGLVRFAESLQFSDSVVVPYLQEQLAGFDLAQYGTVVLGCTHFPYFIKSLRKVLPPGIDIIDGAGGTVRRLKAVLTEAGQLGGGSGQIAFYSSGNTERERDKFHYAMSVLKGRIMDNSEAIP